ncbi:MAG: Ferredoxin-2 [Deltaproteobacteria bacterium ADurb.Bin510]|nr:MAG: Ferredoxin-2 [Deltaproteobacteria bacterium ADurb.Bin510]
MAHHTIQSGYAALTERLNRFPQGAPPSELLDQIFKVLFQEREASLLARLPLRPFTPEQAAARWQVPLTQALKILEDFAERAILLDIERNGQTIYILPPPMAGFFEFSLMRTRGDIDQHYLSELFYQYLNVEQDFIRELFTEGQTQLGRVFVHEPALKPENTLAVLDYERASQVIRSASHRGISLCYCRHKMAHLNRACQAPLEICMTFNNSAASLIRHGYARSVDAAEGLDLLEQAYAHNLVQFGENVRERVNFICNCCGCCCEALIAARRFGHLNPVHTTNFLPAIDERACSGCGRCVKLCPVAALELSPRPDQPANAQLSARLRPEACLGCGLCARNCPKQAIRLTAREPRVVTPLNSTHRVIVMAIERGKLQNLIFDNQALFSHRAMAAILGTILRLPPIKQALASQQLKSRYLETLISCFVGHEKVARVEGWKKRLED